MNINVITNSTEIRYKTLLSYLGSCRRLGSSFNPYYDSGYTPEGSSTYTAGDIKKELTIREHIPKSKQEIRKMCQGKLKQRNIDN